MLFAAISSMAFEYCASAYQRFYDSIRIIR